MKEVSVQLKGKTLVPFSQEDLEKLKGYKPNQVLKAKVYGVRKPRSYLQLKMFWACCRTVADNTEDPNWNSKQKVAEQCKVRTNFVDMERCIVKPDGTVHVPYRSISYKSFNHMEACNWFDQAFEVMAKFLRVPVEKLLENAGE